MIPESEISESSEHKVKSKKGKIFVNKKILEECCVKICEIDPYFYEHYEELIKIDKNGRDNILFKIDIYFLNITQPQKLMKKDILTETLFLKIKDKKYQKKKLDCKFIRINTSKENYDADYEIGRIQTFITKSAKTLIVNEISKRLLELEFKSNHSIKSKSVKGIPKKTLPTI